MATTDDNKKKTESNSSEDWKDPNFVPPEGGENMSSSFRPLEKDEQPSTGGTPVNARQTKYRGPVRLQSPWQNGTSIDKLQLDPSKGTTNTNNNAGDGVPTLTGPQVDNIQNAPVGVKMDDINKMPGKSTPTISQSAINSGVLAGAPSQVVIQHMLDAERKPRTPEEQEKLEKKRRRDAIFAAIGDGISALSNLYFTTKGAPSADQSKSISKAISDKAKEEDKEYETAMERRIRLLKEQQADFYRQQGLKIREKLADNLKEHRGNQIQLGKDKNAETMRHNTVTEVQQKQKDDTEAKRKEENDKADNARKDKVANSQVNKNNAQGAAATKNASTNAAKAGEQKRHNQAMENKKSSGGGGGGRKYNGPTYSANYDAKTGELKGYTVKGRGTTPPTKTGGKSAKSRFSIHK